MTSAAPRPLLYHSPQSRSTTARWLLEEIGEPYDLHVLNLAKGEHKSPEFLAINPMGKVPTLRHGDALVTECGAIACYLADAFPAAGLAPPIGDPARGTYLRWMFFGPSCVEPAVVDKSLKREPGPPSRMGYGTYETTIDTLAKAVAPGPYILGDKFSAVDVTIGNNIRWMLMWKLLPDRPEFTSYVERLLERPALQRQLALDQELSNTLAA